MKVLIGCEESQIVLKAFLRYGHDAYSCDLKPSSGHYPDRHIMCDIRDLLSQDQWDMIIAFPPCTYLSRAQQWMCNKSQDRRTKRAEAVKFVKDIYNSKCPQVIIENPPGELSRSFRKYDQLVYPYQFGDPYRKEICLWLKGVRRLNIPEPGTWNVKRTPMQNRVNGRMSQALKSEIKSKFFPLLADSMARQWGSDR